MNRLIIFSKYLSILFIAIFSVQAYTSFPLGDTSFWWITNSFIIFFYVFSIRLFFKKDKKREFIWITIYLSWNIISIIHGCFVAETYWDWKGLVGNVFPLLLPIVSYISTNIIASRQILYSYIYFGLPLFVLFIFITTTDSYGFYLIPISFICLFFSALSVRWKIIVGLIAAFVISIDLGARSNVIKFAVPFFFVLLNYLKFFKFKMIIEFVRLLFLTIPIALFYLAAVENIDVFNISNYMDGNQEIIVKKAEGQTEDLTSNTRSFLYKEVLQSAAEYNFWWFGRSPARGNKTKTFGNLYYTTGRQERLSNEVGILNIFTWTGLIGVILYFLVFYRASFLAIHRSNNSFSKMLGLYIAFRWVYAWVEDINNFTLNYYMIWFTIGICCSREFRMMNDIQIKSWVRSIFSRKNSSFINTNIEPR